MPRTTLSELEILTAILNDSLDRPRVGWQKQNGHRIAQIGHLHVDGNSYPYGGFALYEIVNESGGVRDVSHIGREPLAELAVFLRGMIEGIESASVLTTAT